MRVIYIGCVLFSNKLFETVIKNPKIELVGLITKKKSNFNSDHFDLSKTCQDIEVPFKYISDINNDKVVNWIYELKPEVIFCFGWPALLNKKILNIPRHGVLGYHPSNLPKNRGRHPIIWALVLGLKKTGSTFFLMDEGADTGKIISQKSVSINNFDDASSLYEKLIEVSKKQLSYIIKELSKNKLSPISKPNSNNGNFWRKRNKFDGLIDWRMSSACIYNLVRGLSKPYVGAHFIFEGKEIKVWKCQIKENKSYNIEPGKVIKTSKDGVITVKTGDKAIDLIEHELYNLKANYLL